MTTLDEQLEIEEPESLVEEIPYYISDESRLEEVGRSLAAILLSRRCPSCSERPQDGGEPLSAEAHIREIAECCATQEGFIRPDMPMQEIVIRSLLVVGNQPTSVERLHFLVTEEYYTPMNPRSITAAGLTRVLDNDVYYGFKRVPQPV